MKTYPICIIDNHHGVYIPMIFSELFSDYLDEDTIRNLSSPENEFYWETWDDLVSTFTVESEGVVYHVEFGPCGDVFTVPEGMTLEDDE